MISLRDPERYDAWIVTRVAFAAMALCTWVPRSRFLREAYSSAGVVLATGRFPVPNYVVFGPVTVFVVWGVLIGALLLVARGRFVRPALLVYLVCAFTLLFTEGLHMRAYDRLAGWQALVLLVAPCVATSKDPRDPFPRTLLLIVYAGLYGSTGFYKLMDEPGWLTGRTLAYHLVDRSFGSLPIGVFVSKHSFLYAPMAWWTLVFECTFPFLCWWRRTNPWILVMGLGFHFGIFMLMDVFTFSPVAISAYAALLHPDAYMSLKRRALAFYERRWGKPGAPAPSPGPVG